MNRKDKIKELKKELDRFDRIFESIHIGESLEYTQEEAKELANKYNSIYEEFERNTLEENNQ